MTLFENQLNRFIHIPLLLALALLFVFFSPLSDKDSLYAQETPENTSNLYEPVSLLLTWQDDPTTTMTIDWHTLPDTRPLPPSLLYRKEGANGEWHKHPGTMHPFPYTSRTVNRVELTGLEPGTTYEFRIGPAPSERYDFPQSRIYSFRTMPEKLDRPLRVVVGGDNGSWDGFIRLGALVRDMDIDFVVIGGDIAYSDAGDRDWRRNDDGSFSYPEGNETKRRWLSWFDVVQDKFITTDGRVIPVLAGIGNHEVWMGYAARHDGYEQTDAWRERIASIYYNIFAFPGQPGYAALDFSDYLTFILLDSGHSNPIEGEQTEWLARILEERSDIPHIFPIYHIASYPTVRPFDGEFQTAIRQHWAPLFDRHNLYIAFENHDHTYKRTHPIRNGAIDPAGVVYLGDGAFGMGGRGDRMHDVDETWYLNRAKPDRHFILMTLDESGTRFEAINKEGEIIDRYPEDDSTLKRSTR